MYNFCHVSDVDDFVCLDQRLRTRAPVTLAPPIKGPDNLRRKSSYLDSGGSVPPGSG